MSRGTLVAVILLFAGCYDPQIKNGGFTCHPPDHPQCPDGMECIAGICQVPGTTIPTQGALPDAGPFSSSPDEGHDL
jgi:hypothetical protein